MTLLWREFIIFRQCWQAVFHQDSLHTPKLDQIGANQLVPSIPEGPHVLFPFWCSPLHWSVLEVSILCSEIWSNGCLHRPNRNHELQKWIYRLKLPATVSILGKGLAATLQNPLGFMRCRQNGGRNGNYKDCSATYLLRRCPNDEVIQWRNGRVSSCWSAGQVKGASPPLDGYPFFQLHHREGMIVLEGIIGEKSRARNTIKSLSAESSPVHLFPDYHSTQRQKVKFD